MRKKEMLKTIRVAEDLVEQEELRIKELEAQVEELEAQLALKITFDTANWKEAHKQARLEAADEFIWWLTIMMAVGEFEDMSLNTAKGKETREAIGEQLKPWVDNAYAPWEGETDADV